MKKSFSSTRNKTPVKTTQIVCRLNDSTSLLIQTEETYTWEFCLDKIEPLLSCFKSARHELELFCLDKYSPICSDLLWLFDKICLDWMLSWFKSEFLETLESCLSSICRDKLLFCLDKTLCFLFIFGWSYMNDTGSAFMDGLYGARRVLL